jgi:hypothetical protein
MSIRELRESSPGYTYYNTPADVICGGKVNTKTP